MKATPDFTVIVILLACTSLCFAGSSFPGGEQSYYGYGMSNNAEDDHYEPPPQPERGHLSKTDGDPLYQIEEYGTAPDYVANRSVLPSDDENGRANDEVTDTSAPRQGRPVTLTKEEIKEAFQASSSRDDIEYPALDYRKHPPEFRHQQNLKPNEDASELDKAQYVYQYATKYLMEKKGARYEEIRDALLRSDLRDVEEVNKYRPICKKLYEVGCDPSYPYRSLDGTCNNLRHPTWGKTMSCMPRILAPAYDDGLSTPRSRMSSGRPLPNPRELSNAMGTVDGDAVPTSRRHTSMLAAFGQMLDHDIVLTPETRGRNMTSIQCCPFGSAKNVPSCYPVHVKDNDPFYSQQKIDCLNFVRSSGCTTCTIHPREQTSQQTAYVDASHVYGASQTNMENVRDVDKPALLLMRPENQLLPPSLTPTTDGCSDLSHNMFCFRAGDRRVNQQPAIASLQTVFSRQHNRIAEQLQRMNPHWNNEMIYQQTRRILGAQMQNIVYNEFLPVVLGPAYMQLYALFLRHPTYRTQYNERVHPGIINEFATAAFRFGHSLVKDFKYITTGGNEDVLDLKNYYFNVAEFYDKGKVDDFLRGLSRQSGKPYGHVMVEDVKHYLYRNTSNFAGLDLASINIQRGRDHGLPGYGHYLSWCSGRRIERFEDVAPFMTIPNIEQLRKFYDSPHDVDLWVGGLYEKPVMDGTVGTTFACIIGLQFQNLRYGDRFFFTHTNRNVYNPAIAFTDAQVEQIYRSSLAKLVCANSDSPDMLHIQRFVFLPVSRENPLLRCQSLPDTDLRAWKEIRRG
ncbi:chorion peroxidase-like [Ornithodoros turicata]|uniref:chorion peroxidase-like n=1 Tax=Ornithodoros turicata TaxID=34597 RepID=UPI00313974E3